MKQNTSGSRSG